MPEVHWRHGLFALDIAAAAEGRPAAPQLLARYALKNTSGSARAFKLLLAVRPWQVNPPQQFLNTPGGARRIDRLRWQAPRLTVILYELGNLHRQVFTDGRALPKEFAPLVQPRLASQRRRARR